MFQTRVFSLRVLHGSLRKVVTSRPCMILPGSTAQIYHLADTTVVSYLANCNQVDVVIPGLVPRDAQTWADVCIEFQLLPQRQIQ